MSEMDRDKAADELIAWCRQERGYALDGIARFERGQAAFGSFVSGHLVDRTKAHLDSLRRIVENMDRIIEACERGKV